MSNKYLYEDIDEERLFKHGLEQEKIPMAMQISYVEGIKIDAWREVLDMIKEGKTVDEIKSNLETQIHSILDS